jgi:hypothetical protein
MTAAFGVPNMACGIEPGSLVGGDVWNSVTGEAGVTGGAVDGLAASGAAGVGGEAGGCIPLAPMPKGSELAAVAAGGVEVVGMAGVAAVAGIDKGEDGGVLRCGLAAGATILIGSEAAGGSEGGAWFSAT